jgi:hypothetical protein
LQLKRAHVVVGPKHVENSWKLIIDTLSRLKLSNDFNGLEYWNNMIQFLISIDNKTQEHVIIWETAHKKMKANFLNVLKDIPEFNNDGKLIEVTHFLLQQLKIPYKDDGNPSFRRLIQIALNIGQLNATKHKLSAEINQIIIDNNLSDIKTYMSKENYSKYNYTENDYNQLKKHSK